MDPESPETPESPVDALQAWLTLESAAVAVRVLVLVVVGFAVARLVRASAGRLVRQLGRSDIAPLVEKASYYGVFALVLAMLLAELGFDLSVLLGAAGVFTVAVGFAAQTSMSNLISGVFLVLERAFLVGDVIRIGQTTGEVVEIDWLSIRLRTFDNLLVRVPNETLVKTEITNLSRFPIRRYNLRVSVAYGTDVERVKALVLEVCDDNPLALEEPAPAVFVEEYAESGVYLRLAVWAKRESWLELGSQMQQQVHAMFHREGIEIPFPHRVMITRSETPPPPAQATAADPALVDRR